MIMGTIIGHDSLNSEVSSVVSHRRGVHGEQVREEKGCQNSRSLYKD
jgi:hypothetical protein